MVPQLVHPPIDFSLWPEVQCGESSVDAVCPSWSDAGDRPPALSSALVRLTQGEPDLALEELESALDDLLTRRQRRGRAECGWWAGVCSYQLGLTFQARGYWQAALPDVNGAATLGSVCRALSIAALGGASQANALFQETLNATDFVSAAGATRRSAHPDDLEALLADLLPETAPPPARVPHITLASSSSIEPPTPSGLVPVLARALALSGMASDADALDLLDSLRGNSELWKAAEPYWAAIMDRLLPIEASSPEMRPSGFDRRELGRVQYRNNGIHVT